MSELPAGNKTLEWMKGQQIRKQPLSAVTFESCEIPIVLEPGSSSCQCIIIKNKAISSIQPRLQLILPHIWYTNLSPRPHLKHFSRGSKRPEHRVWPFHPKAHTTMHKHRLPNAKRADLFTPVNIPSEEEGRQILSLHLFGLMFARCSLLFPQFFLFARGCRHKPNPLSFTVLLSSTPISPHAKCVSVCVACMHVTACWPGVSLSSLRLLGFIKRCDSCKSPHLLSEIVFRGWRARASRCTRVCYINMFPN